MATRLKELREQKGLSQSQLAKASEIPIGTIRNWEYARRTMMFEAAVKLADALDCTLDELAGRGLRRRGKGK
jgi:transcriptional regulator with XRE-family HTH domain